MTAAFRELERPGDPLTERQRLDVHLRHQFALRFIQGKKVLDVGCGSGFGLPLFAERASSVLAIDQDEQAVRIARRQAHPRLRIERADAHAVPRPDGSFEVILCLQAIMYLDVPRFLAECARLLVPGGQLVGWAANPESPEFVPSRDSRGYPSLAELDRLLAGSGLEGSYWGLRYDAPDRPPSLGQRAYAAVVPWAVRALNLLPNPRPVKNLISGALVARFRLGDVLEAGELERAERACQLVPVRPGEAVRSFAGLPFVATRK